MSLIEYITSNQNIKNNIQLVVILLISALAFSIPFGYVYGRKLIVAILVLWIFIVNKDDVIKIITHKFMLVFLVFIGMYYISLFWSDNIDVGLHYIDRFWIFIYGPILIFATIIKKEHIQYIVGGFIAGMFINEIISYLIYFDLYQTEFSKIHRYPVGFLNHSNYSVLVSFAAVFILHQVKFMKNIYLKYIYIIFFTTMTINLVISGGRTGYIVYFGSLVILIFTYYKVTLKSFLQLLIFPIIIFAIGYKLNEDVQKRVEASFTDIKKIVQNNNYNTSFGTRLAFFHITKDIVSQEENSLLFGVGVSDVRDEIRSSIDRTKIIKRYFVHAHNSYLQIYLGIGIIGLVLIFLIFYFLWKIPIKDKEIRFIQQLLILNICFAMLADSMFHTKEIMFYFAIFVGVIFAQSNIEKKKIYHDI